MQWPQHRSPDSIPASAPYNFVPLPEAIFLPKEELPSFCTQEIHRLHGWIDVSLTTLAPLYTRCACLPDQAVLEVAESEARQQFYHHGDPQRPVIPGSSLRGAVRSLVEILAYSRLTRRPERGKATRILDRRLIYRAVADQDTSAGQEYNNKTFLKRLSPMSFEFPAQRILAGWLEEHEGDWQVRPAKQQEGTSFIRVPVSLLEKLTPNPGLREQTWDTRIYVKPEPVREHKGITRPNLLLRFAKAQQCGLTPTAGRVPAWLVVSGKAPVRHYHTAVYEKDGDATPVPIPREVWEDFHADQTLTRGLPTRKLRDGDPCFYYLDAEGKVAFLGPTLFFRIPYQRFTGDFVPAGITEQKGLDLAESLFGIVNPGERSRDAQKNTDAGSFRGRVRFGDALFSRMESGGAPFYQDAEGGRRVPGILSSPKPTSFQHYLVQTGRGDKRELLSYASAPAGMAHDREDSRASGPTVLRGFKRYWHRQSPGQDALSSDLQKAISGKSGSQHTIIRPVRAGAIFEGRIHFENLSPIELGALLAALELPDACAHQLGMGKPLGMGSVRLKVKPVLFDPQQRYSAFTETGTLKEPELQDRLKKARAAFEKAILDHYAEIVRAGSRPSSFWEIPRLRSLYLLLGWEKKPEEHRVQYQGLAAFKARPTLPTPQRVFGEPDPQVQAELPSPPIRQEPGTVGTGRIGQSATPPSGQRDIPAAAPVQGPVAASMPAAQAQARISGAPSQHAFGKIRFFSGNRVGLLLDGAEKPLEVEANALIFPTGPGGWLRLNGAELRKDRRVKVLIEAGRVTRVVPV